MQDANMKNKEFCYSRMATDGQQSIPIKTWRQQKDCGLE